MREILFKAKRKDNGEWVEGLLWKKKYKSNKIFISCFPDKDDNEEVYVVDETTICQYTGLTDKNGNKIWENDVVRVEWSDNGDEAEEIQEVSWGKHGWYPWLDEYSCDGCDLYSEISCIEVIGNAFDNPELLNTTEIIGYADNGGLMSAT